MKSPPYVVIGGSLSEMEDCSANIFACQLVILQGCLSKKTCCVLLIEVRRQHPDALICYKPRPDLGSEIRAEKPLWDGIENQVDYLITDGDIISWIQAVDEVHTLTIHSRL